MNKNLPARLNEIIVMSDSLYVARNVDEIKTLELNMLYVSECKMKITGKMLF